MDDDYNQEIRMSIDVPSIKSRRRRPYICQKYVNKTFIMILIMVISIGCFFIIIIPWQRGGGGLAGQADDLGDDDEVAAL